MIINSKKTGFTLIEIIVAMGVFGILAVVGTNFFLQIIKNNNRATIQNEVRQTNALIFSDMESEIRKGACVYYGGSGQPFGDFDNIGSFLSISDVNSTSNTQNMCGTDGNRVLYINDIDGNLFKYTAPDGSASYDSPITLNTPKTIVDNCASGGGSCGANSCSPGLVVSPPPTPGLFSQVNLLLFVQQNFNFRRSDFCASSSMSGTISPRNF